MKPALLLLLLPPAAASFAPDGKLPGFVGVREDTVPPAPVLKLKGEAAGPGRGAAGAMTGWVVAVGGAAAVFALGLV
ncbi:hypothetical protein N3K66_005191 [Trichothecium roseum]|uniref:Uncharacterized protein n=1 Tax=Trichothecium roseum TaxID=47278 RepID=A0ACC0V3G2_9HYPO|nr:hypothetical protein N3K66_005191 [Trichothecium roseum]